MVEQDHVVFPSLQIYMTGDFLRQWHDDVVCEALGIVTERGGEVHKIRDGKGEIGKVVRGLFADIEILQLYEEMLPHITQYYLIILIYLVMSLLLKVCPCLTWVFRKKPESQSKKYDDVNELEEEQFMHHLQNQAMKLEGEKEKVDQSSIEEQMNIELGLNTPQPIDDYFKETAVNSQTPSEKKQQTQLLELQHQNQASFKLNIPQYDQYYEIIKQASSDIPHILSEEGYNLLNLNQEKHFKSKLKAWSKQNNKGGQFILDFQLPCSYSYYEEYCNKKIHPKDNKIVQEYKQTQNLKPNLNVKYLCLQKISMLQPRDFTYLKYTNGVEGEHWQVCITKDEFHPKSTQAKMGKIHLVSRITEVKDIIRIRTYMNVDLNVGMIDNLRGKIHAQGANYIEQMWRQVSENYQQELV